jgi:hypothetical protein
MQIQPHDRSRIWLYSCESIYKKTQVVSIHYAQEVCYILAGLSGSYFYLQLSVNLTKNVVLIALVVLLIFALSTVIVLFLPLLF